MQAVSTKVFGLPAVQGVIQFKWGEALYNTVAFRSRICHCIFLRSPTMGDLCDLTPTKTPSTGSAACYQLFHIAAAVS